MPRISLTPPRGLMYRLSEWYCRRSYGKVPDPFKVAGHNTAVFVTYGLFEMGVLRWRKLDRKLKGLAVLASAASIGCEWCLDFGYWELHSHGVPVAKIEAIAGWRSSEVYTPLERLVIEYAEAMTATPPQVTDAMVDGLKAHLSEAQLVELTAIVAVENLRSRLNSAAGLTGQGFKESCAL
ncbi:carboxymuconolactone decarboxylase family protein [Nonomuraea sp. NPDC050556]|uniref:carboxymuconolactone decarboxylase family protein n=1 Tax=Nonomuraea sp. NPDC050556 TaxID=3364369 RepID=UPI00378C1189